MFKSQGLFSSVPCPSPTCTLQHCIFDHRSPPKARTLTETAVSAAINSSDLKSSPDDGRSRKKRIIEIGAGTSSNTLKSFDLFNPSDLTSTSKSQQPSTPSPVSNMLDLLPRNSLPAELEAYSLSNFKKSPVGKFDSKRKYTETFNLAAKEFLPSEAKPGPTAPTALSDPAVHPSINNNVRHVPLDVIFKAYKDLYASLPESLSLAARDAAKEELFIAKSSPNAQTYQVSWRQHYARLKKRDPVTSTKDACTLYDLERRKLQLERTARWNAPLSWTELSPLAHKKEELSRWGYITDLPALKPFDQNALVACSRCTTVFSPKTRTQYPCISHWGKQVGLSNDGSSSNSADGKVWSCCQAPLRSRGCTTHPCHVRKVSQPGELASIRPFIQLDPFIQGQHMSIVSLDCEMSYTLNGMELVRLTVLDNRDHLVFDVLVRPESEITDFNSRFSGITREMFDTQPNVSFDEAIEMLKYYVSRTTIVIGHGLENDLNVLRLIHHHVIDTAILYPHPRGRPYRNGLKDLVKRETGLDVQTAGERGHSSFEDAAAASLLVRKKARLSVFPGNRKVKIGIVDSADGREDGAGL
jgi:RNA exonuclease 1